MKKILLLLLVATTVLFSCKKEDVLPKADFNFETKTYKTFEEIQLNDLSKNAVRHEWSATGSHEFTEPATFANTRIRFDKEGMYDISLKVTSKDGKEDVRTKSVLIDNGNNGNNTGGGNTGGGNTGGGNTTPPKSFTIKNLTVTNYPTSGFGFGDDPDVFFKFVDSHDNVYYDWGASNRINNATGQALKFFNLNYTAYVSTGTYYLQLIDYDPIPPNQTMGFCGFNLGNHNQNPSTTINVTCTNGISYTLYGTWNY